MCNTFSNLVFKVSKMLSKEDLDAIAYLYKLPVDPIVAGSSTINGLPYLRELEKRDIFSSANVNGLRHLLNTIQRSDLIELIEEYERYRQRHFAQEVQRYTRTQEECIRLDISYAQAKRTEQQLVEFQKEFTAFCSRLPGDSPGVRQFYSGMLKRLKAMMDSCRQFILQPLHEIIHFSYLMPGYGDKRPGVAQQCLGNRHCESQNPFQPSVPVTTGVYNTGVGELQNQRNSDHLPSTTHGQTANSTQHHRSQTTTPIRVALAAPHSQPPQIHSMQKARQNAKYDMLSPILISSCNDQKPPSTREVSRDGINVVATSGTKRTSDKKRTSTDNKSCPKSLNVVSHTKTRQHTGQTLSHRTTGRTRTSKSSSAVSVVQQVPAPKLKRVGSADNVLESNPSRIPKLHQLFYYKAGNLSSHRDGSVDFSDLSGGSSFSESDVSSSTDSGIEIARTRVGRHPQNSSDESASIHLVSRTTHSHKDKDHCDLSETKTT